MGTTNTNLSIRRRRPIFTATSRKQRAGRNDNVAARGQRDGTQRDETQRDGMQQDGAQQDQVESTARAFRQLAAVYGSMAQILRRKLDRSGADIGEIAALGRQYEWISDRRRKVRMVLEAEPVLLAYVHADCREPERTATLAASAVDVARISNDLNTALAVLEYVDHELGWASSARAA